MSPWVNGDLQRVAALLHPGCYYEELIVRQCLEMKKKKVLENPGLYKSHRKYSEAKLSCIFD